MRAKFDKVMFIRHCEMFVEGMCQIEKELYLCESWALESVPHKKTKPGSLNCFRGYRESTLQMYEYYLE